VRAPVQRSKDNCCRFAISLEKAGCAEMEAILQADLSKVLAPSGGDRVYKDECIYSFQTPESEGGLYVSLSSFAGLGPDYLSLHHQKTGETLYLHITRTKKPPSPKPEGEAPPAKKPTRLAMGVDGGFDGGAEPEVEWAESHQVVVMPTKAAVPFPNADLPQKVKEAVEGILAAPTASKAEAVVAWEGDKRTVSRHAENLRQLNNGVRIPPSGWKCKKCDLTSNLWLNLTDGSILCGRRYFDGSGGNNHAVEHYERHRYPLGVKLGTITPAGGDVYSYAEDDMVEDPKLAQHLQHFGINVASMTKTDATMTELEIEANMKFSDWSIIQEAGQQLTPCYGPGYTGLGNLGNSCYLNSVVQVLFSLDEFKQRYYARAEEVLAGGPAVANNDFTMQMCKLSVGLLSGRYSRPPSDESANEGATEDNKQPNPQNGIKPAMFKMLIGKGHFEFSSNRQQDASEFLLHLLATVQRTDRALAESDSLSLVSLFQFQVEERIQCMESGQVRYITREDSVWRLPVAIDDATNKSQYKKWVKKKAKLRAAKERINPEDEVRAELPFTACLRRFESPVELSDFYSTAVNEISPASKTSRFATFPEYLILQMNRFFIGDDWTPQKYDVEIVAIPEELDITSLRGRGLQPDEEELPEGDAPPTDPEPVAVEIDEGIVMQLVSMGFDIEGCKKAVFHTKNQGVEPAMNWVLEHMGDPDFSAPFTQPNTPSTSAGPDEGAVAIVMSLGFTRDQALKALKQTGNNVERAADWVFSHTDELDAMETEEAGSGARKKCPDGPGSE
jgi:ubiquitin carboxyl-terminal hydrolase 5/13